MYDNLQLSPIATGMAYNDLVKAIRRNFSVLLNAYVQGANAVFFTGLDGERGLTGDRGASLFSISNEALKDAAELVGKATEHLTEEPVSPAELMAAVTAILNNETAFKTFAAENSVVLTSRDSLVQYDTFAFASGYLVVTQYSLDADDNRVYNAKVSELRIEQIDVDAIVDDVLSKLPDVGAFGQQIAIQRKFNKTGVGETTAYMPISVGTPEEEKYDRLLFLAAKAALDNEGNKADNVVLFAGTADQLQLLYRALAGDLGEPASAGSQSMPEYDKLPALIVNQRNIRGAETKAEPTDGSFMQTPSNGKLGVVFVDGNSVQESTLNVAFAKFGSILQDGEGIWFSANCDFFSDDKQYGKIYLSKNIFQVMTKGWHIVHAEKMSIATDVINLSAFNSENLQVDITDFSQLLINYDGIANVNITAVNAGIDNCNLTVENFSLSHKASQFVNISDVGKFDLMHVSNIAFDGYDNEFNAMQPVMLDAEKKLISATPFLDAYKLIDATFDLTYDIHDMHDLHISKVVATDENILGSNAGTVLTTVISNRMAGNSYAISLPYVIPGKVTLMHYYADDHCELAYSTAGFAKNCILTFDNLATTIKEALGENSNDIDITPVAISQYGPLLIIACLATRKISVTNYHANWAYIGIPLSSIINGTANDAKHTFVVNFASNNTDFVLVSLSTLQDIVANRGLSLTVWGDTIDFNDLKCCIVGIGYTNANANLSAVCRTKTANLTMNAAGTWLRHTGDGDNYRNDELLQIVMHKTDDGRAIANTFGNAYNVIANGASGLYGKTFALAQKASLQSTMANAFAVIDGFGQSMHTMLLDQSAAGDAPTINVYNYSYELPGQGGKWYSLSSDINAYTNQYISNNKLPLFVDDAGHLFSYNRSTKVIDENTADVLAINDGEMPLLICPFQIANGTTNGALLAICASFNLSSKSPMHPGYALSIRCNDLTIDSGIVPASNAIPIGIYAIMCVDNRRDIIAGKTTTTGLTLAMSAAIMSGTFDASNNAAICTGTKSVAARLTGLAIGKTDL